MLLLKTVSDSRGVLRNVSAYGLSIFVFLVPRMVPGPGQCYISAPCLQSGLISAILFILFAQRALFQPGKKKKSLQLILDHHPGN